MLAEQFRVSCLFCRKKFDQFRAQRIGENRTKSAVQNLPSRPRETLALRDVFPQLEIRVLQLLGSLLRIGGGRILERGRNVVGGSVLLIAGAGEGNNPPE